MLRWSIRHFDLHNLSDCVLQGLNWQSCNHWQPWQASCQGLLCSSIHHCWFQIRRYWGRPIAKYQETHSGSRAGSRCCYCSFCQRTSLCNMHYWSMCASYCHTFEFQYYSSDLTSSTGCVQSCILFLQTCCRYRLWWALRLEFSFSSL